MRVLLLYIPFLLSISLLCRGDFHYKMRGRVPSGSILTAYCFSFSDEQNPKVSPLMEGNPSRDVKWEKGKRSCELTGSVSCLGYEEGPPNGVTMGDNPPSFLFEEPITTSITVYLNFFENKTTDEIEDYKKDLAKGCHKVGGIFQNNDP